MKKIWSTLRLALMYNVWIISFVIACQSPPNYYALLQISPQASKKDIRKAYFTLAKKTHPDKLLSSEDRSFVHIKQAYDVLYNDEQRHEYDATLSLHQHQDSSTVNWCEFLHDVCTFFLQ